jgi:2-keto-4-pentenoate hydratase/2-oxohepta-3-ene-1,7-dioic acid hydratase in catechol pathway
VNGERRQQGNTRQMIRDVPGLIEYASSFYTLYPGDIFLSGTPAGVGPLKPGDQLVATIEKIGAMKVSVRRVETDVRGFSVVLAGPTKAGPHR